jgi:hypothetical protein
MYTALLIVIISIGLLMALQIYTSMATKKSETQTYTTIRQEEEFEIRYYPSVIMATITSSAKTYKELGSFGFTKLAGYIFGGNKDKKQIAMTSPVHMDIGDSLSSMGFVMPLSYTKDNLPIPNNSDVTIKTISDEHVAVITFGGFASDEKIKKYTVILEMALKKHHLSYYGNFRFLGYNPPYQLFERKNEIIVTLNWNSR